MPLLSLQQQQMRSARAYLHAESRSCQLVLRQWLSVAQFGQRVVRCSELWSRRGAGRAVQTWLVHVERMQMLIQRIEVAESAAGMFDSL